MLLALPPLLLQATWPAVHPLVLALLAAAITFLATWFWKVYDANRAQEKAESQAIADLKAKQQSDILKMEGAIALVVNAVERLTDTAEQVTTIAERVAGNSARLDETRREFAQFRDSVQPAVAKLQAAFEHLRHVG